MIATLFYLKSLGCCGCISMLVTLVIVGGLLAVMLQLVAPGFGQQLCQFIPAQEAGLCPATTP